MVPPLAPLGVIAPGRATDSAIYKLYYLKLIFVLCTIFKAHIVHTKQYIVLKKNEEYSLLRGM